MEKSIYTPEYAALCAELVRIRAKAGLTQRELAKRLKVSNSWVAKIETGERRIDFVELYRVLAACDATPLPALTRILKKFKDARKEDS